METPSEKQSEDDGGAVGCAAASYAAWRAGWLQDLDDHRAAAARNDGRRSDFAFGTAGAIEEMISELDKLLRFKAA